MRSILKKIGCDALHRTGLLKELGFKTRILAYHKVHPSYFEPQMVYLKKHYDIVPLEEAITNLDRKQVVITFDDGYRNNYEHAYPVLKKLNISATVFITYEFIDKNIFAWWDRLEHHGRKHNLSEFKKVHPRETELMTEFVTKFSHRDPKPNQYDFMKWEEVKEIMDIFEIGSHTLLHSILTKVTEDEAREEIFGSKKRIEEKIGRKIRAFAYPNGDFNDKLAEMARSAGYGCAVLYDHYQTKANDRSTDPFKLHRRGIGAEDSVSVFASKVAGVF